LIVSAPLVPIIDVSEPLVPGMVVIAT
jgi:hypothetical protein